MKEGDILQSPNYPYNYPNNVTCQSLIEAPEGNVVRLKISDFSLEPDGNQEGVCSNDHDTLRLHDGLNESATSMGEFCGSLIPESFISTGRYMRVVFKSDGSHTRQGFQSNVFFAGK